MERKHLIIALVVVGVLMVLSPLGMDYLWKKALDYTPTLEESWDLVLPEDAESDTLYGMGGSATGPCYHIITCKDASYFETMLPWSDIDPDTMETAKEWLEELSLDEEVCPQWENCRFWERDRDDGSRLFLLWDRDRILLHVLEYLAEEA